MIIFYLQFFTHYFPFTVLKNKKRQKIVCSCGRSVCFKVVYTCRMILMWLICKISLSHVNENCLLNLHIVSHTNSILNVVDDIKNCTLKKLATHTHHQNQQQHWHWRNQRYPRGWIRAITLKSFEVISHKGMMFVCFGRNWKKVKVIDEKNMQIERLYLALFFSCVLPISQKREKRKNLFYDTIRIFTFKICVHDDREEIEFLDKHK